MLNLSISTLISRIITLIIAFTVHEFAHAWVAKQYGDDTAERAGRLTLNPLKHLDPIGTLMLIVGGFGWAKPVPVNTYALDKRSSSAEMFVSIAGPISNLLLAVLAAIPFRTGLVQYTISGSPYFPSISQFLFEFIIINLALLIFNLIPLAPLDGEKVLTSVAPPKVSNVLYTIRPYGPLILLGLIMLGRIGSLDVIGWIMGPPLQAMFRLLVGV